jgi:hypothetical protein
MWKIFHVIAMGMLELSTFEIKLDMFETFNHVEHMFLGYMHKKSISYLFL